MMIFAQRRGLRLAQAMAASSAFALGCGLAVPAAAQSTPATSDAAQGNDIVVTGQRAAERAALQTKRNDDRISDVISADDVGKLPDQNVAEATRRLPGISVANDQGEGRYLIVRGIAPDLANVTVNGLVAPAPEPDGRQVKLDDIPSAVISGVDVFKSLTPDLDANAIAGQVDIRTLSAFERSKSFLNARVSYGYYNQNGKNPFEADLSVGGRFGASRQFGIVIAGNYSRRPIESQTLLATTDGAGPTYLTVNGQLVPQYLDIRDYNLTRTRKGLVGNFDWHPSAGVKLYVRAMYSAFSDAELRDRMRFNFPTPNALGVSTVYTNQTATSGTITAARDYRFIRNRAEDDHTINLSTGGDFNIGGGTLSAVGAYAQAVKVDPRRNEFTYQTGASAVSATYDLSDFLYNVTPSATAYDPTKFTASSYKFNHRRAVEDLYQGKVDYKVPIGLGDGSTLQFGAKYLDRHKTNNQDGTTYSISNAGATLALVSTQSLPSIYDGRYPFGPLVNYDASVAYFNANPGLFTVNNTTSVSDSLASDYDIREKIWAGYAMATLKFGDLTVIPGVRIEHTKGTYAGKTVTAASTATQDFNSFASVDYTNVFPGVNLRYNASPNLVLRGAVTTSLGRPDYSQLAPYVSVDTGANTVSEGNPNLKPVKSLNVDAAAELYLRPQGVLSIAAFYKDIKNPIFNQGTVQTGTFAGLALTNASVGVPLNAQSASVFGIELNAQFQLTFLPGLLDGFGVSGNITYVDSKVHGLPGRTDEPSLFNTSKFVGTAQLYYEKYGFSARVAYSYRSHFLANVGTSPTYDGFVADHGQLDARASYQIVKQATIFLEGSNLNNAPFKQYLGIPSRTIENERYGYALRGGVQLNF